MRRARARGGASGRRSAIGPAPWSSSTSLGARARRFGPTGGPTDGSTRRMGRVVAHPTLVRPATGQPGHVLARPSHHPPGRPPAGRYRRPAQHRRPSGAQARVERRRRGSRREHVRSSRGSRCCGRLAVGRRDGPGDPQGASISGCESARSLGAGWRESDPARPTPPTADESLPSTGRTCGDVSPSTAARSSGRCEPGESRQRVACSCPGLLLL